MDDSLGGNGKDGLLPWLMPVCLKGPESIPKIMLNDKPEEIQWVIFSCTIILY